jgi:recombination protein RecA
MKSDTPDKTKALNDAVAQIEKNYGKGSVMRLGDTAAVTVNTISTGSLGLDVALGVGGFPRGRIIEIYGPESSGKTTLTLHSIAEVQRERKDGSANCVFIDAEHAFDVEHAKKLGVDTDNLLLIQPDNGEQALESVDTFVRSGAVDMVVVDSVAALVPKAEIEGEMGDHHMGLQARLMSQALRKLTSHISKTNCIVIFINQIRHKIGVMFGNPETTTGGNALKFFSSIRLDIRRIGAIKNKDIDIGNSTKIKVVKNKLAPPFKVVNLDIMYDSGISVSGEVIDMGADLDIIERSGTWYFYNKVKLGQGRENAKLYLDQNKDLLLEIKQKIKNLLLPTKSFKENKDQ